MQERRVNTHGSTAMTCRRDSDDVHRWCPTHAQRSVLLLIVAVCSGFLLSCVGSTAGHSDPGPEQRSSGDVDWLGVLSGIALETYVRGELGRADPIESTPELTKIHELLNRRVSPLIAAMLGPECTGTQFADGTVDQCILSALRGEPEVRTSLALLTMSLAMGVPPGPFEEAQAAYGSCFYGTGVVLANGEIQLLEEGEDEIRPDVLPGAEPRLRALYQGIGQWHDQIPICRVFIVWESVAPSATPTADLVLSMVRRRRRSSNLKPVILHVGVQIPEGEAQIVSYEVID